MSTACFRTSALAGAALLGTSLAAAPARADEPAPPPDVTIRVEQAPPRQAEPPPRAYEPPPRTYEPSPPPVYHVPVRAYTTGDVLDWREGEPVPDGYRPVRRANRSLVMAGAITFGSVYVTTGLAGAIAADAGARGSGTLLVPVLGPFIMAGLQGSATGGFMLVLDGLAQAAGVTMFAVGLAQPRAKLVRVELGKVEVTPVPMTFGPSSAGLGFVGRF
jgi:hypothetical protein